jgi:hypothetical protein
MHHRRLWLAFVAMGAMLQACAERAPSGPPARVYAADMTGAAKVCTAPPLTPAARQTTDAAIKLGNDGGWCAITVNNGGRPFDAGLLVTGPQHGKVLIHTVGNDTRIDYTPTARFAGADAFSVRLLPGEATVRVAATVTP